MFRNSTEDDMPRYLPNVLWCRSAHSHAAVSYTEIGDKATFPNKESHTNQATTIHIFPYVVYRLSPGMRASQILFLLLRLYLCNESSFPVEQRLFCWLLDLSDPLPGRVTCAV